MGSSGKFFDCGVNKKTSDHRRRLLARGGMFAMVRRAVLFFRNTLGDHMFDGDRPALSITLAGGPFN